MNKRTFLTTVASSLFLLTAANAFAAKPLSVAMDAAYPPFGSKNSTTGDYVGFDVDIIKAIGKAEGFQVNILNLPFDGLIPALLSGNIDIAINDITITEERAKSVDFSDRYYIAGLGVVVKKDNTTIKTAKDLEGKHLSVSIGSTGEIAAKKIKGAKVSVFNQLNEAFMELQNGGVDAVINDIPTNDYYVVTGGKGRVKSLEVALSKEDLGIAVRKGNKTLLQKINHGLKTIKANGVYTQLYKKWFGKEPPQEIFQ